MIIENEAALYKQIADTFNFNNTQLLHYIYSDELAESVLDYHYYLNPTNTLINMGS